jgi:HEAT repeat protein
LWRSDRQAVATLIDLFGNLQQPETVRTDAATALALSGDTQALEALRAALRGQDDLARRAAAEALALIGSRDGAAEMATLLDSGPSETVMIDAARGLGLYDATVMGEPHTATEALLRAVSRHHLAPVRKAAVEAFGATDLGRAGDVRQTLVEVLRADAAGEVRAAAARCLAGYVSLAGGPADVVAAAQARLPDETDAQVLAELLPVLRFGDAATLAALQAFAGTARARGLGEVVKPVLAALQERVDATR